ncbi:hypothetical protein [Vibrio marisflavi]|uniref:hypothetical protein n=1 Tax=Vibrio marisflavi TaxID=1216040 RepID=UPI001F35B8E0|nr:hypothetical protein [Vibrio marisflavi]
MYTNFEPITQQKVILQRKSHRRHLKIPMPVISLPHQLLAHTPKKSEQEKEKLLTPNLGCLHQQQVKVRQLKNNTLK